MNNVDRAKQFLPFDALKGFKEALILKEIEIEKSIESNNGGIVSKRTVPIDINGKIYSSGEDFIW